MQLYDENGQVLKYSRFEIEQAKERVMLKRSIRRKTLGLLPINNLSTDRLITLDNLL